MKASSGFDAVFSKTVLPGMDRHELVWNLPVSRLGSRLTNGPSAC
jgi:hypothetical protein